MSEKILKINDRGSKKHYLLINFGDSILNLTVVCSDAAAKEVSIMANEEVHTKDLKEGFIKNMESVQTNLKHGIKRVKEAAKLTSPNEELDVICTISSSLGKRISSQGVLSFINDEITEENIDKVIQLALYNSDIPKEAMAINYMASNFKVDGVSISNPISMNGKRLEVELDIQTVERNLFNNFKRVVNECGLDFDYIQFDTDNIIQAILGDEDMDYGSILFEFGLEFSRLVFVKKNAILKSVKVNDSANRVVAKIAQHYGLKYPEAVKIYQNLDFILEYSKEDGYFEIEKPSSEIEVIRVEELQGVIASALKTAFEAVKKTLRSSRDSIKFNNGVVFVNNTSLTSGIDSVIGEVFSDEVLTIRKYDDVKAANPSILNMDSIRNKFDILGDVKFLKCEGRYTFDYKDSRYPKSELQKVQKIDLKHLEEFGQGEAGETGNEKKKTMFGSMKRAIIELW